MIVSLYSNSSKVVDGECRTFFLYSCHRAAPAVTFVFQGTYFNLSFIGYVWLKKDYKNKLKLFYLYIFIIFQDQVTCGVEPPVLVVVFMFDILTQTIPWFYKGPLVIFFCFLTTQFFLSSSCCSSDSCILCVIQPYLSEIIHTCVPKVHKHQ